jgi:hypothetical protein
VEEDLPQIIENPEDLIKDFEADFIIDHLSHGDLTDYLVQIAREKGIPVMVPNRRVRGAITPPTCCALNMQGFKFGRPEFDVEVKEGRIADIKVLKGAPCGATWLAAEKVKGTKVEEAIHRIALEVQYLCRAPSRHFLTEKAPLHVAGEVHMKALKKAIRG